MVNYINGDNTSVTGGWTKNAEQNASISQISISNQYIDLRCPNAGYAALWVETVNAIDITPYKYLVVKEYKYNDYGNGWAFVSPGELISRNVNDTNFSLKLSLKNIEKVPYKISAGGTWSMYRITEIYLINE